MALDRDNQYQVQSIVVQDTARSQFNIFEPCYILIYNTHAAATVVVYASYGDDHGISVPPGGFRTLPRLPGASMVWIQSDIADTTVEMWTSATKWASDYMASELTAHIDAAAYSDPDPASGITVSVPDDPPQVSTVPYVYDFLATLTRYGTYVTFYCTSHACSVALRLKDDTAVTLFNLEAGRAFTAGDGAEQIDIHSVRITPLTAGAWSLNLWGY